MKIGTIDLGHQPLLLAPMEDVTDVGFRTLCKKMGADLVYSEFVSADALIHNIERTQNKLTINEFERPVAIQIYGKDVVKMVEAAKIVAEYKPNIIDINFGCPVRKIATKGSGAGLLQDIPQLIKIAEAVAKSVDGIPVTAKTRLGWDDNNLIIVDLAEKLQDVGMQAISIHGRTRCQMYKGEADWTLIGEVKNNPRMKIPVIGNGDISSPEQAKLAFDRYGVDGVMIGRATIGNYWLFKEIKHYLLTNELLKPYTLDEQIAFLLDFYESCVTLFGERRGILHSRRHFAASPCLKGLQNIKDTRIELLRAQSGEEIKALFKHITSNW